MKLLMLHLLICWFMKQICAQYYILKYSSMEKLMVNKKVLQLPLSEETAVSNFDVLIDTTLLLHTLLTVMYHLCINLKIVWFLGFWVQTWLACLLLSSPLNYTQKSTNSVHLCIIKQHFKPPPLRLSNMGPFFFILLDRIVLPHLSRSPLFQLMKFYLLHDNIYILA